MNVMEAGNVAVPQAPQPSPPALCPRCHQPVLPGFYFCPNCGKSLREPPPSVASVEQAKLYAWSIITPALLFISLRQWDGMKYLRSSDPQAKQIGIIAAVLMALTTVVLIWLSVESFFWFEQWVASQTGNLMGG